MKYNKVLNDILGQKTKVKILRYLVGNDVEQSGMRIAQETGINHWQALKVLKDLHKQGVLQMTRAGNTYMFKLRAECYFNKEIIIPLFKAESDLITRMLHEALGPEKSINKHILSAVLYGSLAKGIETPNSDIDLFVVVNENKDKEYIHNEIMKNNDHFLTYYGNTLSPYVVSKNEFIKRNKKGDKFVNEVLKTGRVIYGKSFGEILTE